MTKKDTLYKFNDMANHSFEVIKYSKAPYLRYNMFN